MLTQASKTAEHVALFRALESTRRSSRLFVDPYAEMFLPSKYRLVVAISRFPVLGSAVAAYIDWRWPSGPRPTAVVRTRLIDDMLASALHNGATQLLILGAGYDSRAFRICASRAIPVFEVDHRDTQERKRRILQERIPASAQAHVSYVSVDLERENLGSMLKSPSFTTDRTVVIWEGVTNYLTAGSVDRILRWVSAELAESSTLIFSYVDRRALDGTIDFPGFSRQLESVQRTGEDWRFGFDPAETRDYLAARGLQLVEDLSTAEGAEKLLLPLDRSEAAASFYRVAEARVM